MSYYEQLTSKWLAPGQADATVKLALDLAAHGAFGDQRAAAKRWIQDHPGAVAQLKKNAPGFVAKRIEEGAFTKSATTPEIMPFEKLEQGLRAFCKAENIPDSKLWTVGLPRFQATTEGARLKRRYDEDPRMPEREVPAAVVEANKRADANAALETGLDAFCVAKSIPLASKWTVGLAAYEQTAEGRTLREAVNAGGM